MLTSPRGAVVGLGGLSGRPDILLQRLTLLKLIRIIRPRAPASVAVHRRGVNGSPGPPHTSEAERDAGRYHQQFHHF